MELMRFPVRNMNPTPRGVALGRLVRGPFSGSRNTFWSERGSAALRGVSIWSMGADQQSNRLLQLPITAIQNRVLIAPVMDKLQAALTQTSGTRGGLTNRAPVGSTQDQSQGIIAPNFQMPALTADEKAALQAIAQDPTDEELKDLATIDAFFPISANQPNPFQVEHSLTRGICEGLKGGNRNAFLDSRRAHYSPTPAAVALAWLTYVKPLRGGGIPNATADELSQITDNKFFCEEPATFPSVIWNGNREDYGAFFQIDQNSTWGQVKQQVENAVTLMNVYASFPFPPPIDQYWPQWWGTVMGDVVQILKTPAPLDPEAVRTWITLSVIANYSGMVDRIQADLKRAAKKAKRKALMTAVGLAVLSIVAAFALPAVIALAAAALKVAVQTYIDAQKRREAARDMADSAKLFEKDAPAFSAEVDRVAKLLDEQAAKEQAALAPTPAMKDAIQEVQAETPTSTTTLVVGGGIVAAVVGGLLLLK